MRTIYDLLSVGSSAIGAFYFVHAFLALHERLSRVREAARTEAPYGTFRAPLRKRTPLGQAHPL